jgi:hypothetical protein
MIPAPRFHLTAVGATRIVGGPPKIVPLRRLFHRGGQAELATEVHATPRNQFPDPDARLIASVVNLRHVPDFMRAPARLATLQSASV